MNIKGIDYDLGNAYVEGITTRTAFDPEVVKREIGIIKHDLHCNAIRLNGKDIQRLTLAGEFALDQGLQVWFLPKHVDATQPDTLYYLVEAAQAAETLRRRSPNVTFIVGCEFTLFMQGILEGANIIERIGNPANWEHIRRGKHNQPLNDFLTKAVAEVRQHFHGPLTYASIPIEKVEWSLFDYVGVDHYREVRNRPTYRESLDHYSGYGKPVIITEFGCCAYKGAEDKGARGWEVMDRVVQPPLKKLIEGLVRDEAVQANELIDLLQIFDAAQVEGTFVYTFAAPADTYNDDPLYDFDMANYGIVTSYADSKGTTYPDLLWEPKQAFGAIAEYYKQG